MLAFSTPPGKSAGLVGWQPGRRQVRLTAAAL